MFSVLVNFVMGFFDCAQVDKWDNLSCRQYDPSGDFRDRPPAPVIRLPIKARGTLKGGR